ncbi:MAG: VWA domain-containing protein [Silvibacterium sp.]
MLTSQLRRLLAVLLSPVLAIAQTAPPASDNTLHVTTRIVYVDVVVHDSSGHLVRGLTQNDFKVLEDGKPQQIDFFAAHTYEIGAPHPAAPPVAKNVFSNVPDRGPVGSVNMMLFDLVNTAPADQQYARKQMLAFLKALPPGQQVALFVLSDQLHMFQSFTGSSDLLVAAAKMINPKNMRLYQSDAEQQRDIDNLGIMWKGLGGRDPGQSIQALANEMTFENEQTAEIRQRITLMAFAEISHAAAGYPGRKNLFWLSGSFPFSLSQQSQYNITAPLQYSTLNIPETRTPDFNAVADTAKVIADAQIAVYPISAIGLEVGGVGVEVQGGAMAALSGSSGITSGYGSGNPNHTLGDTVAQQFTNRSALRGAMDDIAYTTGGEAVFGSNDLTGALRRTIEDGSNYYTLAYLPQNHDWNGKFRQIKVEMSRSGYSMSYRRGYFAFPDQITNADTAQALNTALQPGAPESTLLLLKGKVELPDAQHPETYVETTVDPAGVNFSTDAAGHHHAKLLVLLIALNDSPIGAATQPDNPPQTSGVIRLDLDPTAYAGVLKDGIRFQQKLVLKPGRYRMRLGVSDMNNNRLGTLDMPVEIGPPSAGGN